MTQPQRTTRVRKNGLLRRLPPTSTFLIAINPFAQRTARATVGHFFAHSGRTDGGRVLRILVEIHCRSGAERCLTGRMLARLGAPAWALTAVAGASQARHALAD